MPSNYKNKVIKQYLSCCGLTNFDPKSEAQAQHFDIWAIEMGKAGYIYREFVDQMLREKHWFGDMESIYENCHSAEIGKGYLDSLVKKGSNTYTITEYVKYIYGNCINAAFMPNKGEPILRKGSTRFNLPEGVVNLITQNPYNLDSIIKWGKIHRLENANIIIGFFGKKNDCDRQLKMNQFEELKIAMRSNYEIDRYEDTDNYYGIITPKEKVKEIVRK